MTELKGFRFVTTLFFAFKRIESDDKRKYDTFYLSSKIETIINESDIDDVFESIHTTIISNMQKTLRKCSGCITDSVIDYNINISKCNSLGGSSYIKLLKELDHPRKGWINIQNINDNECFIWCLVRYLKIFADHNLGRITKDDKDFSKRLDFKDKILKISNQN